MRCKLSFSNVNDLRDESDENGKMAPSGNHFRWFKTGINPTGQQTKQDPQPPRTVPGKTQAGHSFAISSSQNDGGNSSFLIRIV